MFGLGAPEVLLLLCLLCLGLLLFRKQLPALARSMGRMLAGRR